MPCRHSAFGTLVATAVALIFAVGISRSADPQKAPAKAPEVVGKWTGDWGPYDPAKGVALDKAKCKVLDCQVLLKEAAAGSSSAAPVWEATFEGECGRPYKYTIKMDGRQASDVVLFKGTVDLGEKDGGVYDWVGRATATDFAGFYTSSHHVGVFSLKRVK
jgi:hypothetical protein